MAVPQWGGREWSIAMTENKLVVTPWVDIASFFPAGWREKARELGVMKGARQDKDLDATMHSLLLHLVCGLSLKETVVRASLASPPLFSSSHVALRSRLIKFSPLFRWLAQQLFDGGRGEAADGVRLRLLDATDVCEPGPTGSQWRFHYSFTLPDMACDYTRLTETRGKGTGEGFHQFPMRTGDLVIADRGYSSAAGIAYADGKGAKVCVRVNTGSLKPQDPDGHPFRLEERLRTLREAGEAAEWRCRIKPPDPGRIVEGRICAVRKTPEAIRQARARQARQETKHGHQSRPETALFNEYVILFTTFDREAFPLPKILGIYRWRWQIELVFKRFKSLLQFGHLPTAADEASKAWLYGKLFSALLVERIARMLDGSFSPWRNSAGWEVGDGPGEPVETLRIAGALAPAEPGPAPPA